MSKCNFSDINMNEPMGDLRSQIMGTNTQTDGAVFKTVLFYSVLILLLPIGSFFVTKSLIFEGLLAQVSKCENILNVMPFICILRMYHVKMHRSIIFQESTIGTNIVSAVVAVIVLHLALGLFIYKVTLTFSVNLV